MTRPCCTPSSGRSAESRPSAAVARGEGGAANLVELAGGAFAIGADDRWTYPEDGESPVKEVEVSAFSIGTYAVSNAEFAAFVRQTGYVTDAERFRLVVRLRRPAPHDFPPTQGVARAPWWRKVDGANWCHPEGPHSSTEERPDHPAVHVSWSDADAYCAWPGKAAHRDGVGVRRARRVGAKDLSLGGTSSSPAASTE